MAAEPGYSVGAIHAEKQQNAAADAAPPPARLPPAKYSRRVAVSTILGRPDRGLELAGERAVVGGWVKSSREVERPDDGLPKPQDQSRPPSPTVVDLTCSELLLIRFPVFRSIARLLGGPHAHKFEQVPIPAPPSGLLPEKPAPVKDAFLRLNDGSCIASIQIFIDSSLIPISRVTPVGTSILVEGILRKPTAPGKHAIELKAEKILHVGIIDNPSKYPLTKKGVTLESLRNYPHLRPRTTTFASIARIRNGLSHATHMFFQQHGFFHVHTPVISFLSSESKNEVFQVTPPSCKSESSSNMRKRKNEDGISLEVVRAAIKEKSRRIEELKRSNSNKEALNSALLDLNNAKELSFELEEKQKKSESPPKAENAISKNYFGSPAHLSKSAEPYLESYACAISSVYTLGPIFHAGKPQRRKDHHEMWAVNTDLAFAELEDVMNCAEDYLKFQCRWILENCSADLKFTSKRIDKNCADRLQSVISNTFQRITYSDAIEVLRKTEDKIFKTKVEWGMDLLEEHECYLANEVYKKPFIICDHPKKLKPFFLRLKDDQKTISSFDIVVPMVGTLIRGGQLEERADVITRRIEESGLSTKQYEWYLDLRRYGAAQHSGFSVILEHMAMFVTGMDDARDVIPFPLPTASMP